MNVFDIAAVLVGSVQLYVVDPDRGTFDSEGDPLAKRRMFETIRR